MRGSLLLIVPFALSNSAERGVYVIDHSSTGATTRARHTAAVSKLHHAFRVSELHYSNLLTSRLALVATSSAYRRCARQSITECEVRSIER